MNICVYGAASSKIDEKYIALGESLGRKMAERGHGLVFGAGSNGMMGAVARGVYERGGNIIGISPKFFDDIKTETVFNGCTELIRPDTMRERKKLLDEKSDAFIVAPGGIGTFDEFYEILTLKQLGRHNRAIVVYNMDGYYDNLIQMMKWSISEKFITEECFNLFAVTTTVEETLSYIENYVPKNNDINDLKLN